MAALLTDLRIAYMNLVEHRRRTLILGAAIAAVTSLFVLLTSLSTGIRHAMIDSATTLTTGHLNVGGFFKVTAGQAETTVVDYEKLAEVVRRNMPEVDSIVDRGRGWGKVVSDTGSMQILIGGIDIAAEPGFKRVLKIASGNIDDLAQPNSVLLFEQQAKKLDVKTGDAVTVMTATTRGAMNTLDCRVVAIAHEVGFLSSAFMYVSNESLRNLLQLRSDVTGVLQIQVKPRYLPELNALAVRLRKTLAQAGYRVMEPDPRSYLLKLQNVTREEWTGQMVDVTTWEDEVSFLMWTFHAVQGLSFVLLLILLVIMMAGITNTLWIAIRERTREIGTLRAIGMQRAGVARLFLLEATLLGVFGACGGALFGALLIVLVNAANVRVPYSVQLVLMRNTLYLALEPSTLLWALLMITGATGAAAVYPALRAARRKPVDAMAHFG
jgi:putative ABC transport system permease protein